MDEQKTFLIQEGKKTFTTIALVTSTKRFLGEFEEFVLLAIMKLGKDRAYGVPIAQAIEGATGRRVSTGALYTALARLEEKGFILSYMGEATPERGGRAKKYFELNYAGKQALQDSHEARKNLTESNFVFT